MSTPKMESDVAKLIRELGLKGSFASLERPKEQELLASKSEFPMLSQHYWQFVTDYGTGEVHGTGFSCCLPYLLSEETNNNSLKLYRGASYQSLRAQFGQATKERLLPLPENMAVICSPGASWRYCLAITGGDQVYCYDFASQQLSADYPSFTHFVARSFEPATRPQ